jgi:hypothetical protein
VEGNLGLRDLSSLLACLPDSAARSWLCVAVKAARLRHNVFNTLVARLPCSRSFISTRTDQMKTSPRGPDLSQLSPKHHFSTRLNTTITIANKKNSPEPPKTKTDIEPREPTIF